jgi:hypothetical protein
MVAHQHDAQYNEKIIRDVTELLHGMRTAMDANTGDAGSGSGQNENVQTA